IATASGGYRLQVDPERLDASRMQLLVASARESVSKGELEHAAERFREALALWRGPTLAGLQLESRGRDEVAQLDELRLAALMDWIDCDLALGWQLALAGLVILAASAATAVILSTSGAATPRVVPNSLVRIDPRSGKIVSVTSVGAEPQEIAVTPRGVWTDNLTEGTVTRYDLRTHNAQTLGTPPEPFDVVADAGNTWVSSLRSSSIITRFAAFGTG